MENGSTQTIEPSRLVSISGKKFENTLKDRMMKFNEKTQQEIGRAHV